MSQSSAILNFRFPTVNSDDMADGAEVRVKSFCVSISEASYLANETTFSFLLMLL
jgi:hypothetical protein